MFLPACQQRVGMLDVNIHITQLLSLYISLPSCLLVLLFFCTLWKQGVGICIVKPNLIILYSIRFVQGIYTRGFFHNSVNALKLFLFVLLLNRD